MLADYEWRLDVRLREGGGARWVPIRRAVRTLVSQLSNAAFEGAMIVGNERDPAGLLVFAASRRQIESVQRQLETLLASKGMEASVSLDRWSNGENQWTQVSGSTDRAKRVAGLELDDVEFTSRARAIVLALAVVLAAGSVAVYVAWPYTFPAYQASTLGTMPLLITVLIWLGRRLPKWLQWTAAILLLPVGAIGYLVAGGAQWWDWGQLTGLPFLMLVFGRVSDREERPWMDTSVLQPPLGPFGPP